MHIRDISINGFGILADQQVVNFSRGVNVFLGDNEAGKSTCLGFFRSMLFGYPEQRGKVEEREPLYLPLRGGEAGGRLHLKTSTAGEVILARTKGAHGGPVTLTRPDGTPCDESLFTQLQGGVTRALYTSVYGFSLSELQTFSSLKDDKVRHALYGASFGAGTRPVGEVLTTCDTRLERLFKNKGQKQEINAKLKELADIRDSLQEYQGIVQRYDLAGAERKRLEGELLALRTVRAEKQAELEKIVGHLNVWEQWVELRTLKHQLGSESLVVPSFPQDGLVRFEQLKARIDEKNADVASLRKKLDHIRQEIAGLSPDDAVLRQQPVITSLAENKNGYKTALHEFDELARQLEHSVTDLNRQREELGGSWDDAQLRSFDRSIFTHERIDRFESIIEDTKVILASRQTEKDVCKKKCTDASHAVEKAKAEIERFGDVSDPIDEEVVRLLSGNKVHIDTLWKGLPRKEEALSVASKEIDSDILALVPGWTREHVELFDTSYTARESVNSYRREGHQAERGVHDAEALLSATEKAHQSATVHYEESRQQFSLVDSISEGDVAKRKNAVRKLRLLQNVISLKISQREYNTKEKLTAMTVSVLGGLTAVYSLWVSLLSFALLGGLIFLAGAGLCIRSFYRNSAIAVSLKTATAQAKKWAKLAHAPSIDEAGVLAAEDSLEQLQQIFSEYSYSLKELKEKERVVTLTGQEVEEAKQKLTKARTQAVQQQEKWLLAVQKMHLPQEVSPELALSLCDRVEALRDRLNALFVQQEDVRVIKENIAEFCSLARRVESLSSILDENLLFTAVDRLLEEQRAAQAQLQERVRVEQVYEERLAVLQSCEEAFQSAAAEESAVQNTLDSQLAQWKSWLRTHGLPDTLSPRTARNACDTINSCVALLDTQGKLRRRQNDIMATAKQFVETQDALLAATEISPVHDALGKIDRLATVDVLQQAVQEAQAKETRKHQLEENFSESSAALETAKSQLLPVEKECRELLENGNAKDEEEFRIRFAAYFEQQTLRGKIAQLEASLAVAAGKDGLEDFLQSLAAKSQDDLVAKRTALSTEISDAEEQENALRQSISDGKAAMERMVSSDDVAEIRLRESELQEDIHQLSLEWARYAVAKKVIMEAKQTFERERQPQLIRDAGQFFATITNNAYQGLRTTLEGKTPEAVLANGMTKTPDQLSRGTQEQLYLALRLGYILGHSSAAEALPVIMDDILVNFDPTRARHAAQAFGELAQYNQVFFFTCHPQVAELFTDTVEGTHVYTVQDGNISARL